MDNRLREIEQWVAEARDGLSDGGREAYVRKLYLLDAEIRAVIKDSGILPQADSPRPAISHVRRLSSLALPVTSALVVLAVSTVYLRGGIQPQFFTGNGARATSDFSILTARPESAQKNTPPAGPSSTPQDWRGYLALQGEEIVPDTNADEPVNQPARQQVILANSIKEDSETLASRPTATAPANSTSEDTKPAHATPLILASANKPTAARPAVEDANESTSVASGVIMLASYAPRVEEEPALQPPPKKEKNRKAKKSVGESDSELELDLAELEAAGNSYFER